MDPLLITLTKAGLSAIVGDDSPSLGPVVITRLGLTDATFTVASTLEALPGEFKRIDVSGQQAGDDTLHMTALDASDDVYSYRGFALYLADGTLFAVYGQSGPIAAKAAPSTSFLVLDIKLAEGQAENITFGDTNFLNPPATTTRQGVVELATDAEASAGADTRRAITPAAMQAALLAMLGRVDGADSGIDADLLDGQHGAWYADIIARLGYTPLDAADFTKEALLVLLADYGQVHTTDNGFWRRNLDGSIEQWGHAMADETSNPAPLNFPTAFADLSSINLQVTARYPNIGATSGNKVGGNVVSTGQFNLYSDDGRIGVFWRALGKGA